MCQNHRPGDPTLFWVIAVLVTLGLCANWLLALL
jgi:hypothetical protein